MKLRVALIALASLVVLLVALLLASPTCQGLIVYLHILNWPLCDLSLPANPQSEGLLTTLGNAIAFVEPNAQPFRGIQNSKSVVIDVGNSRLNGWHIKCSTCLQNQSAPSLTVIYFHGNAGMCTLLSQAPRD
jgi:hypothetical protein